MGIEIHWIASTTASAFHAAAAMLAGRSLVDEGVRDALADEVDRLREELLEFGCGAEKLMAHLVPASTRYGALAQLAEVALRKALGPEPPMATIVRFAQRLAGLTAAFCRAKPGAIEELELRSAPLQTQWEARGPGLMVSVGRLTEPALVVDEAEVVLVQPVLGGGGAAHWLYNSVRIEAVLVNPVEALPEVVRLGWLLSQLNLDLARFESPLSQDRQFYIGSLALVPAVLAAAEEVELVRGGGLSMALSAWNLDDVDARDLAEWWEAYRVTQPPWNVALGALDRMLGPQNA